MRISRTGKSTKIELLVKANCLVYYPVLNLFCTLPAFYMKQLFLLIFIPIYSIAQSGLEYANSIKIEGLKKHLTIISSDSMEGRETGTPGQFRAAEYISNHFRNLNLQALVKDKTGNPSYYQSFNLYKKGWTNAYLRIGEKKKKFFQDFYPVGLVNIPEEVSENVVFAGYGISENIYDDYKKINVSGKGVMLFAHTPEELLAQIGKTEDLSENQKADLAFSKGASTVFIISDKDEKQFNTSAAERKAILSKYNRMMLQRTGENPKTKNPTYIISEKMAAEMLSVKVKKIRNASSYFGKKNESPSTLIENQNIAIVTKRDEEEINTMNVLGFLEGTSNKNEVVVISAHYDHIGMDDSGKIYNGADDDGSGTCAVLEIAEAFSNAAKDGLRPKRSILFTTFAGEEKGLLGSRFFTDMEPLIPLNQIVVDLNIDMIGRIDKEHSPNEKYVYLIGADKLSSQLQFIADSINTSFLNYQLDYTYNNSNDPNRFYYRSDHYNFAKNKIPVIFYFTGVHEDYHRPGDDEDKIMYNKYTDIVRYVFLTAWELANRKDRIEVDSDKP